MAAPVDCLDPTTTAVLRAALHDLKGPASRLRVLAQLLQKSESGLDDDSRTLVRHIADSTLALDTVIAGLRTYTELCGREPCRQETDLAAVLARAKMTLPDLEVACDAAGMLVIADPYQIEWVFKELLANAARHAGPPPVRVHVSMHATAAGCQVSVVDNGPGIEAALAERAFRPFHTLTRQGRAGIGLTICRKIIEMHGGRLWLEARAHGAEVRFVLPEALS